MAKTKTPNAEITDNQVSTDRQQARILFHGDCPKLSPRATGKLSYEIGIHNTTNNPVIRIAGNESSGAFNHDWIEIRRIRERIDSLKDDNAHFKAINLRELFTGKSANNHGYLGAVLKNEGVLVASTEKPSALSLGKWEPLMDKIETLKKEGVNLTDHIAIAEEERARKKAQMLAKRKTGQTKNADDAKPEAK